MNRRSFTLLVGLLLAVAAVAAVAPSGAQQKVQVEFWHGLAQPLGGILEKIVADFNASQSQYQVNPSFKGSYPETMVGAIAAFRAGNAPHIVQMFDVGTATMMSARGAVKPVYELMKEHGIAVDWKDFIAPVVGFYSEGRQPLLDAVQLVDPDPLLQQGCLREGGAQPAKPPLTWKDVEAYSKKISPPGRPSAASPPGGRRGPWWRTCTPGTTSPSRPSGTASTASTSSS
jgi:sn-glycerol 3-phosphate transport system substrate-binding protein